MSESTTSAGPPLDRHLGVYDRGVDGPSLLIAAGIHGNEPSGVAAFRRVLERLKRDDVPLRGRVCGLAGNLQALATGERFITEDLNRIWSPQRIDAARSNAPPATPDGLEQAQLLAELDAELSAARGPVYFLDLHTSSAPGQPFVCIGDTLRNRAFAMRFDVPIILGLEEQVDGALLEYINNLGHTTVGVEAGQHDDPRSADVHESFVALALVACGCVDRAGLPEIRRHEARLRRAAGDLPPVLEVRHRHAIEDGDGFRMTPGYTSFDPVAESELLAQDDRGEIRAVESGRVLLPLYQGLGNDGFFLVREFSPFWLRVSALLRRLGLSRIAHWLPGVRRDPEHDDTLLADDRIARWYTVEIFHLLGFRKRRARRHRLAFTRRRE